MVFSMDNAVGSGDGDGCVGSSKMAGVYMPSRYCSSKFSISVFVP